MSDSNPSNTDDVIAVMRAKLDQQGAGLYESGKSIAQLYKGLIDGGASEQAAIAITSTWTQTIATISGMATAAQQAIDESKKGKDQS